MIGNVIEIEEFDEAKPRLLVLCADHFHRYRYGVDLYYCVPVDWEEITFSGWLAGSDEGAPGASEESFLRAQCDLGFWVTHELERRENAYVILEAPKLLESVLCVYAKAYAGLLTPRSRGSLRQGLFWSRMQYYVDQYIRIEIDSCIDDTMDLKCLYTRTALGNNLFSIQEFSDGNVVGPSTYEEVFDGPERGPPDEVFEDPNAAVWRVRCDDGIYIPKTLLPVLEARLQRESVNKGWLGETEDGLY